MKPTISIQLVEGPLSNPRRRERLHDEVGAVIVFEGIVRREEGGRNLKALRYEAYEPMTQVELDKLASRVADQFQLDSIGVEHSIGEVAVGEISFRLTLTSSHRAEAIAACDDFIKTMKARVPLWKTPIYSDE